MENVRQADGGVAEHTYTLGLFYLRTRSLLLTYWVSFTYIAKSCRQTVVSQVAQELQSRVKGTHALKIIQVSFNYIGLFYLHY